jgi:hypothetical protein
MGPELMLSEGLNLLIQHRTCKNNFRSSEVTDHAIFRPLDFSL